MRHPLSGRGHPRWPAGVAAVIARDERGTVMVEYALVLMLLSLGFVAGMRLIENATAAALSFEQTELMYYALRNGS